MARGPETTSLAIDARVASLEIRVSKFGFVTLEGARLLDWGVRSWSAAASSGRVAARKLASLLDFYHPAVLLIRGYRRAISRDARARLIRLLAKLRSEARQRSIRVKMVRANTVRAFFGAQNCWTKHAIATMVAERFNDLARKLPPKRKPWQSEPYNAVLFDAAATAMAFLNT